MKLRYLYRIHPTNQKKMAFSQIVGLLSCGGKDALSYCQKQDCQKQDCQELDCQEPDCQELDCQETDRKADKKPSYPELSKIFITQAKKTEERIPGGEDVKIPCPYSRGKLC